MINMPKRIAKRLLTILFLGLSVFLLHGKFEIYTDFIKPQTEVLRLVRWSTNIKHSRIEISEDYRKNLFQINSSLRNYPQIRLALNLLLAAGKLEGVSAINLNQAEATHIEFEEGILSINISSQSVQASVILQKLAKFLDFDLRQFLNSLEYLSISHPEAFVDENQDFKAINLILNLSYRGREDLIFMINSAYAFRQMYPEKEIRVIFRNEEDFNAVVDKNIMPGLEKGKTIQKIDGITFIQGFGKEFIKPEDISITYVTYEEEEWYWEDRRYEYNEYAKPARVRLNIHGLGNHSGSIEPIQAGDLILGFGEKLVGLPPGNPNFAEAVREFARCSPEEIMTRRAELITNFPGISDLIESEKLANYKWGFIYAYTPYKIEKYLSILETARRENSHFGEKNILLFINYAKGNRKLYNKVLELAEENNYSIIEFDQDGEVFKYARYSPESKITLIMDYLLAPDKLNEELILANDLPSLISSQDNLTNILRFSSLVEGRAFFTDVLGYGANLGYEMKNVIRNNFDISKKEVSVILDALRLHDIPLERLAQLFYEHDSFRSIYQQIGTLAFERFNFPFGIDYGLRYNLGEEIWRRHIISKRIDEIRRAIEGP